MKDFQLPSAMFATRSLENAGSLRWWRYLIAITITAVLAGCAVPTSPGGLSPEEAARLERLERANNNFSEGLKLYDAGNYDQAMKGFLVALDSGLLSAPLQLNARKHMAFIYCVSSRESNCKEEFEKAFALDAKFELAIAEAGHPIWGPVFRSVKAELEQRRAGRPLFAPPPPKPPTAGEKLITEGMTAYDAADYNKTVKSFTDALKETLSANDQIRARKFTAFSYCLTNRMTLCRQEFDKILMQKADFDLLPAEAGHPSWGPSFRAAKARTKAPTSTPTPLPTPAPAPAKKQ